MRNVNRPAPTFLTPYARAILYGFGFLLCLLLLLCVTCYAQVNPPAPVTVVGHTGDAGGSVTSGLVLHAQLANCGSNQPRVFGYFGIVKQSVDLLADPTTGIVAGTLWPNDVISCGNVTGSTEYLVSFIVDNVPQGPAQCFVVQSSQNPFNFDTAQTCTTISPPPGPTPPYDATFHNLTFTGLLTGPNAIFTGTVQAHQFLLDHTPSPCPAGQYMTGYTANFTAICAAGPANAVTSVFGRVGPVVATTGDYSCNQITGANCNPVTFGAPLTVTTGTVSLAASSAAGTYTSFGSITVDGYGRVTAINSTGGAVARTCSGSNCYRKSADGTIEQWGSQVCNSSACTVTFPIAFTSTTDLSVTATIASTQGNLTTVLDSITATSFGVQNFGVVNVGGSGSSYSGGGTNYWHAIGH